MKPAVDQQEGRRTQIRPLSCVHHNFGLLFDFSSPLTNLCPFIKNVYLHLMQGEVRKGYMQPSLAPSVCCVFWLLETQSSGLRALAVPVKNYGRTVREAFVEAS